MLFSMHIAWNGTLSPVLKGNNSCNKNEDLKYSAHDSFLEWRYSSTLKAKIF
jgi:hypothetical protein